MAGAILEKSLKAAGLLDCAWDLCGVHAEVVQSGVINKGDEVIVCGRHQPERQFNLERPLHTYLRPALRSKLAPDLQGKVDTTEVDGVPGYVTAISYSDSTGYLGQWAKQDLATGAKASGGLAPKPKPATALDRSHFALFVAGFLLAAAIFCPTSAHAPWVAPAQQQATSDPLSLPWKRRLSIRRRLSLPWKRSSAK